MNGTNNPNGQFGAWGQQAQFPPAGCGYYPPNGYNGAFNPFDAEYFNKLKQKKADKKIIGTMGKLTAVAIIVYNVLAFGVIFLIGVLSSVYEKVAMLITDTPMYLSFEAIGSVLFLGSAFLFMYIMLRKKKLAGLLPLGTTYNRKASVYLGMIMLPIVLISTILINIISYFFQALAGLEFSSGVDSLTFNGPLEIFMAVISMAVVPALVEEIAIRGIVMQPLRRYGDWFAIVVSALIFSLLHGNMVQIPYTMAAGIYFGFAAVSTGSLWVPIVLHFCNNLFSVIITCVDSAAPEASETVTAVMLGVIVLVGIVGAIGFAGTKFKPYFAAGVKTLTLGEKIKAYFLNAPMIVAGIILLASIAMSVSSY